MDKIITRTATLADLPVLLEFEQGIIETERPFDCTLKEGTINYYDLAAYVQSPDVEVVVAEKNGELIGSGYALIRNAQPFLQHHQYAYLGFMFVKPAHRGQGVNALILEKLQQWALSRHLTEIRLQVYDENAAAIRAYEKAGFKGHMLEMRMTLENNDHRVKE